MNLEFIEARDLPDCWFQCIYRILEKGRVYTIDRGSYAGQQRLEFDYITLHIRYPNTRPLLPQIPQQYGIPNPVADDYLDSFMTKIMTDVREKGEEYTYGERLTNFSDFYGNGSQIDEVIRMYKNQGFGTNQACMEIAMPSDVLLPDPPCWRLCDTRIKDGKLNFVVYFRSWDLAGGMPANLAAIQLLKEYMAAEIGVEDGEIIASSKGLHLYDYYWDIAKKISYKSNSLYEMNIQEWNSLG
jgi:thymidylate synthase